MSASCDLFYKDNVNINNGSDDAYTGKCPRCRNDLKTIKKSERENNRIKAIE